MIIPVYAKRYDERRSETLTIRTLKNPTLRVALTARKRKMREYKTRHVEERFMR
jgi:hypothetical protein